MLRVLLCSPYLSDADIVKGGINTWGRYIVSHFHGNSNENIELVPISFDRRLAERSSASSIVRIIIGLQVYWKPIRRAWSYLRSRRFDVVHICTSAGYGLFRDMLIVSVAQKLGVKIVVHFHFGRIPELVIQNNWEWKLLRKLVSMSNVAVVMNRPSEWSLMNAGFTNIKYLSNPLGNDVLEKIEILKCKTKRVPRRILFVGHVIRTKGVYELVEACSTIPNIELRIVGKCMPDVENDLKHLAEKRGDDSWLNITGEVEHDEVLMELLQADMFVFPSYTEGFPNVILEAMGCCCPVISSGVGAIPEMLDIDGVPCGVCFKPGDVDQVVEAVRSVIEDDDLKTKLISNAYNRLNSEYIMPKVWDGLVNIWKTA